MAKVSVPRHDQLMNPLLQALQTLGGSGTVEEIDAKVTQIVGFSEQQLAEVHNPQKGYQTEIEYRLAWARTYLKKFGILENSTRGVWALTPKGSKLQKVDEREVLRVVRAQLRTAQESPNDELEEPDKPTWRDELSQLLAEISPPAFERLAQRVLRESGFIQVEVTGRSGDGGIDGKGIIRLVLQRDLALLRDLG